MDNRHHIKAIAIDLDGTLLTSQKTITDTTVQTLRYIMERGIHVSIATGRSLTTAKRFIEQVGTQFPAVCYNGSCIYDPRAKRDLWHIHLSNDICTSIVQASKSSKAHLHAFMNHTLYFTEAGKQADHLEPLSSVVGKVVDFTNLNPLHFTKAMFLGPLSETEPVRFKLEKIHGNAIHVVYSHDDYLEIMTGGATKGSALERLMGMYGISADEVMAFGDADNDKEMLAWARYGVAMENAHETVKSIASTTTGHNDDEGVARKIQEVFGFTLP